MNIQIHVDSGEGPQSIGDYRFQAVPRVGEQIMIGEQPRDVWLTVTGVTHVAVPTDETVWDGMIILNCEMYG